MNPQRFVALPSQTVGPFFHFGITTDPDLGDLATPAAEGEHIELRVRLLDGDGAPIPDGIVELWQADSTGKYAHPNDTRDREPDPAFRGFGRLATGDDGACTFSTVRPGRVPGEHGAWQSSHINVWVFARGLLGHLCTRIYFDDDPTLAEDPVLSLVPAERRATLLAHRDEGYGCWSIDLHLQGESETVFFDL